MELGLFIDRVYWSLVKKTNIKNNKKTYDGWLSKGYNNTPNVTFIIQSHNKSRQVIHIVKKLREWPSSEIIVIDDGSDFKHMNALSLFMQRANEFVIRANDLYENVMYDKAIRFANGKYIALLQDDDDFDDLHWVEEALSYFSKYPRLAICGGNNGSDFVIDEENKFGLGAVVERKDKESFLFVSHVDRAPMWLDKNLFMEKLMHIDFSFAPFQFDDCELCLRAWLKGLQVGWYDARFKSLSAGGMRIWNSSFTGEQCRRNAAKLYLMYKDKKVLLDQLLLEARKTNLVP